jgi:hypothetical protein
MDQTVSREGSRNVRVHQYLRYLSHKVGYQTKMELLDISSLGFSYQYAVKIKKKFRHQNKWEFRSANMQQPKYDKYASNKKTPKKYSKPKENKGHKKMKDTGKWCICKKSPSTTPMNVA